MAISMYQTSAPRFVHMLKNLSAILDKAQAHADAKKIDGLALTSYRLYPDMLPMTAQVQIACDAVKGCMARLAGVENPKHEDSEKTIADLKARIAKTIAFVETIKPAQIDGTEEKAITLKIGGQDMTFPGQEYLLAFAYPNFYFHIVTAYNMLRHNGVEIGKKDFLGAA